MDKVGDKWRENILPVIEQSRYRDLLPRQGSNSRGGKVESLQLRNGASLKFLSGGGSDKSRAGFTARVVVVTETDGMDRPGNASRESDKITQLEARTRAYGTAAGSGYTWNAQSARRKGGPGRSTSRERTATWSCPARARASNWLASSRIAKCRPPTGQIFMPRVQRTLAGGRTIHGEYQWRLAAR